MTNTQHFTYEVYPFADDQDFFYGTDDLDEAISILNDHINDGSAEAYIVLRSSTGQCIKLNPRVSADLL